MKSLQRYINAMQYRTMSYINQRRGWTTDRKIIVIESDDWGSIRMPSRKVYERSLKAGYRVDLNMYEKYDSLESEDDLIFLFECLSKFKDINENHPQITANSLVANPDFEKIKKSGNTEYFIETVDKTFASYPKHSKSMDLWYEGEEKGVFFLQYHGREHFNQFFFMEALHNKKEEAFWLLKNKMGGCIAKKSDNKNHYVAASAFKTIKELDIGVENIKEGIRLFKSIHNKESKSYIGTNYIWPLEFEDILKDEGVKYIQGITTHKLPIENITNKDKLFHFIGEVNRNNQIYLIRNCFFEPTSAPNIDSVSNCLKQIEKAFDLSKPAIISSHRCNYIGYIFEENRDKNLKQLSRLITEIQRKWPDVEFMNSEQLGDLIQLDRSVNKMDISI